MIKQVSRSSMRLRALVGLSGALGLVAMASTAMAGTAGATTVGVSATVGPVVVPEVPVTVCVDNNGSTTCQSTPSATTVSLAVSASVNSGAVTLPTVTPGTCPLGSQGIALVVTSGSVGTVVSGSVILTVNGTSTTIPVSVPAVGPNQTVTVSACASPGVGTLSL